jgi:hypothetical protein
MNELSHTVALRADAAVPPWRPVPPAGRTLAELSADIRNGQREMERTVARGAMIAIAQGESLIAAKALVRKEGGLWEIYLALEVRLAPRTARVYMQLAEKKDELYQFVAEAGQSSAAYLSQSQALKALRLLSADRPRRRRPKPKQLKAS